MIQAACDLTSHRLLFLIAPETQSGVAGPQSVRALRHRDQLAVAPQLALVGRLDNGCLTLKHYNRQFLLCENTIFNVIVLHSDKTKDEPLINIL